MALSGGYVTKPYGRSPGRVEPRALPPVAALKDVPPPHDLVTERTVIAGVVDGKNLPSDVGFLQPPTFFSGTHRVLWGTFVELERRGVPIDKTSVIAALSEQFVDEGRERTVLAEIGGEAEIVAIYESAPATLPMHFVKHARRLEVLSKLRELAAVGQRVMSRCFVDRADPADVFAEAERLVGDVVRTSPGIGAERLGVDALIESPMPDEPPWVCPAILLGPGRPALAAGSPTSGKTLAWMSAAVSVASGVDLWGVFRIARRGLVVHLNWDQELEATKRRYRKLLVGGGLAADAIRGYLEVIDDPPFSLDTDAGLAELRAICRTATLVIIDALTGAFTETDEKDPAMGRWLRKIGKISEQTGCAIVIIHHAVKPPQMKMRGAQKRDVQHDVRGTTAIAAASGALFFQQTIKKGELYAVEMGKPPSVARASLDPFALHFIDTATDWTELDGRRVVSPPGVRVVYVTPEELAELTKAAKKPQRDAEAAFTQVCDRVLEVLKTSPGLPGTDVKARMGRVAKDTVFAALRHLKATHRADFTPGARGAQLWRAT